MDKTSNDEEALREAACVGNLEEVNALLKNGVNVNSSNKVNGWTALHWAAKRGHIQAVEKLLEGGADKTIKNLDGQVASDLTKRKEIRSVLGAPPLEEANGESSRKTKFVPNYLANPEFVYSKAKHHDISTGSSFISNQNHTGIAEGGFFFRPTTNTCTKASQWSPSGLVIHPDFIILCVRLANVSKVNCDFIEVEINRHAAPSLSELTEILCSSLDIGIKPEHVGKIRKLPQTVLRNDRDVLRLTDYQMLEIVLQPNVLHPFDGAITALDKSNDSEPDARYLKEHVSKLIY